MSPRKLALATLVIALSAGCGSSDPSTPDTSTTTQQEPLPKVGECHQTLSNSLPKILQPSPVVSCTAAHTLETVAVVAIPANPSAAQLRAYNTQCSEAAKAYVGLTESWPTRFVQYILISPSDASQKWLRCDIGIVASSDGKTVSALTSSLKDVVTHAPASVSRCLEALPAPALNQPYVPCTAPHRAAAADAYATVAAKSAYPSAADLIDQGQTQCTTLVADRPDSDQLKVYAVWQREPDWKAGRQDHVNAVCWYYRADGKDLPPVG